MPYTHSDYCDEPLDQDGNCAHCRAEEAQARAEYESSNSHVYTREEIMDVYSHPSDAHKRASMLEQLGF